MLRQSLYAGVALIGLSLSFTCAEAQQGAFQPVATGSIGQRGQYGGGFIEMLMTGNSGGANPRSGAVYQRPPVDPMQAHGAALYGADPMVQQMQPRRQMAAYQQPGLEYERPVEKALDPRWQKQEVAYDGPHKAGTLIIDTQNKFLFLVQPGGRALRYGIGVGRPGFTWVGVKTISRKAEWPAWTPPPEMLKRRPDLPRHMAGGPENPLGARAMYLGSSLYRIHGTNEPHTIGQNVSSGCIRLTNDDVTDLYGRVRVGAKVIVM